MGMPTPLFLWVLLTLMMIVTVGLNYLIRKIVPEIEYEIYVKLLNNGPLLARYLSTSFPFLQLFTFIAIIELADLN